MHFDNNLLINEIKKGSTNSFNRLFTEYYQNLCRFAYTFVKDADISEEIVQELFISIWERRQTLNINTSARAFLYTSIKNRALNYLRNEKTRIAHEDEFAQGQSRNADSHIIDQAISELPFQCRTIIELRRKQNLSNREIATQLNLSVKTVENQINIAIKKLREKLAPYLSCILLFFL